MRREKRRKDLLCLHKYLLLGAKITRKNMRFYYLFIDRYKKTIDCRSCRTRTSFHSMNVIHDRNFLLA